jgi:hypothetical protein
MTAVFTYAGGDIAFVAADTMRVDKTIPAVARKVYRWSDRIVFGQTGAGKYLGELAGAMITHRDQFDGFLTRDALIGLYRKYRPGFHAKAVTAIGAAKAGGLFVVACAAEGGLPAKTLTLDFATETILDVAGDHDVYAEGSNAAHFLTVAQTVMASLRGGAIALDAWACQCLEAAHHNAPTTVGWPADLIIGRPDGLAQLTVERRMKTAADPQHPIFEV